MKKIDLKCSNCGAMMQLSEDKTFAECQYCKNKILLRNELSIEEQVRRAEQISYAKERGEIRANQEAQRKQKRLKVILVLFVIFLLVGLGVLSLVATYLSKEPMEDPFKCINIKFYGIDGTGKAEVINNETCENYPQINYSILSNENLKEGQTISVVATSDTYRFDINAKDYTVTGLSKYLTKLEQLTDETITKLHNYSKNHLNEYAYGISFKGEVVSITPYKIYLYSNGKNKNILYDVYKTTIKTRTGRTFDKYIVAYYENFLLLTNNELFSYSRLWHCGNTIEAGDPNVYTANSKDYAGFMNGFLSIEDFKSYINKNNDGSFEITER